MKWCVCVQVCDRKRSCCICKRCCCFIACRTELTVIMRGYNVKCVEDGEEGDEKILTEKDSTRGCRSD